jgi:hypothetical protein
VVENSFVIITQDWVINFNMETLVFHMVGHNYSTCIFNPIVGVNQHVCKDVFETSIMQVKSQCFATTNVHWIDVFLNFELMHALGIMCPQFLM